MFEAATVEVNFRWHPKGCSTITFHLRHGVTCTVKMPRYDGGEEMVFEWLAVAKAVTASIGGEEYAKRVMGHIKLAITEAMK